MLQFSFVYCIEPFLQCVSFSPDRQACGYQLQQEKSGHWDETDTDSDSDCELSLIVHCCGFIVCFLLKLKNNMFLCFFRNH